MKSIPQPRSIRFYGQDPVLYGVLTIIKSGEIIKAHSSTKSMILDFLPVDLVDAKSLKEQVSALVSQYHKTSDASLLERINGRLDLLSDALQSAEQDVYGRVQSQIEAKQHSRSPSL
ncbi:hypothetical protein ACKF11_13215 [Methylobacillus sp. Pita2]|uniref:hypothetical protein n=1 Tax=Methylobacillus sp. Pita2 TaxID=3383245 RepID=UPI0038B42094